MEISIVKRGNFYNVTIGPVTIMDCARKTGAGAKGDYDFISFPRRKFQDRDGADKWADVVKVDREVADKVLAAVIELEEPTEQGSEEPYVDGEIPF